MKKILVIGTKNKLALTYFDKKDEYELTVFDQSVKSFDDFFNSDVIPREYDYTFIDWEFSANTDLIRIIANHSKIVQVDLPGPESSDRWRSLIADYSMTLIDLSKPTAYLKSLKSMKNISHDASKVVYNIQDNDILSKVIISTVLFNDKWHASKIMKTPNGLELIQDGLLQVFNINCDYDSITFYYHDKEPKTIVLDDSLYDAFSVMVKNIIHLTSHGEFYQACKKSSNRIDIWLQRVAESLKTV